MNSRDLYLAQLLRDTHRTSSEAGYLQKQAMEMHLRRSDLAAIAYAVTGIQTDWIKDVGKLVAITQSQVMHDWRNSSALEQLAASVLNAAVSSGLNVQSMATEAIAASMARLVSSIPLNDILGHVASSVLRDTEFAKIGADSFRTIVATLRSDQHKAFATLNKSFAGIAADALREAFEYSDKRDDEALARFEKLIDEKIATLPHNKAIAESLRGFLIMLFLTIFGMSLTVYQILDAKQSSKAQVEFNIQVMSVFQRIANNTDRLIPEKDQNVYYVVERRVNLKVKPLNGAPTIATIPPNQKTRLVQMNHKWIYIEYFDYLEGIPKYGWAKKKYFKRLDAVTIK